MTTIPRNHLFIVDLTARSIRRRKSVFQNVKEELFKIAQLNTTTPQWVSIFTFSDNTLKCIAHDQEISDIHLSELSITENNGPGPVLDAIGSSIATWRAFSSTNDSNIQPLVTVFSSVQDKGSVKYSSCSLRSIIISLQTEGWQFRLISLNPLTRQLAKNIGILNYHMKQESQASDHYFLLSQLKKQWHSRQHQTLSERSHIDHAA